MRILVEIEVTADEVPLAARLFEALRGFATEGVKIRNTEQLFRDILTRFELPGAHVGNLTNDVVRLLDLENYSADATQAFLAAFQDVVLPVAVSSAHSTLPYFLSILPQLPETFRARVRDTVLPHIVKHLTQRRPIDCNRAEFFQYAEAFSAMVQLELVSITGAIITMTSMLNKPENRAAALTMLGKTVEICLPLLKSDKCDAARLGELRQLIQRVPEPVFQYDVTYIEENMGWTAAEVAVPAAPSPAVSSAPSFAAAVLHGITPPPKSARNAAGSTSPSTTAATSGSTAVIPAAAATVATASLIKKRKLIASKSLRGHRNAIFALCYDEPRNELLSTGKDGQLLVWNLSGAQPQLRQVTLRTFVATTPDTRSQSHSLPCHYACAADLNSRTATLFLCGVATEPSAQPAVLQYTFDAAREQWTARGELEKPQRLVSCVKALSVAPARTNWFVTGESAKLGRSHQLVLYDAAQNTAFERLQPLHVYAEHVDLITAIAACPMREGLFFSGSRDCSIRLWDARQQASVGGFVSPRGVGHDQMVTCLDALEFLLVSGSLDRQICMWDLRAMGGSAKLPVQKLPVDDTAVLKVSLCPELSSYVAVSTLQGLSLLQWSTASAAERATPFADSGTGRYHDLKWNAASDVLFAAGDEQRVDVYALVPPPVPTPQ